MYDCRLVFLANKLPGTVFEELLDANTPLTPGARLRAAIAFTTTCAPVATNATFPTQIHNNLTAVEHVVGN